MPQLLFGLAFVEPHDAARRQHGHDRAHAEFGRLLQRPVHALAARDGLHQRDVQRRLREPGRACADADQHAVALDGEDLALEIAAAAVEGDDGRALAQAQHARDVVRRRGRQREVRIGRERRIDENAGHTHQNSSPVVEAVGTVVVAPVVAVPTAVVAAADAAVVVIETATDAPVAARMPSRAVATSASICSGVIT